MRLGCGHGQRMVAGASDQIELAAECLDVAARKFKIASRPERPVQAWLPGSG